MEEDRECFLPWFKNWLIDGCMKQRGGGGSHRRGRTGDLEKMERKLQARIF
jgi:hypothetical protein